MHCAVHVMTIKQFTRTQITEDINQQSCSHARRKLIVILLQPREWRHELNPGALRESNRVRENFRQECYPLYYYPPSWISVSRQQHKESTFGKELQLLADDPKSIG